MREPNVFVIAIVALALLAVGAILFHTIRQRRGMATRDANERIAREREKRMASEAIAARTHVMLPDGSLARKCRLKNCDNPAACRHLVFKRDDGLWDFIRRSFGAPSRYRVTEDVWSDPEFCTSHGHLAPVLMNQRLADRERDRASILRDTELDLGHFERVGLYAMMEDLVTKQEEAEAPKRGRRASADKSNVVSLPRTAN